VSIRELFYKAGENIADVGSFGPQFLLRHLSRLTGADTARVRLPGGDFIHLRTGESDCAMLREVFRGRSLDIDIRPKIAARIWRRYKAILELGKTPVIVDAGANIGAASLWFLQRFPQAAVVAVEPEPTNLRVLHKNAAGRDRLSVIPAAIGSKAGFASLKYGQQACATETTRSDSGVPIVTMETAFGSVPNGQPFIAKIDIEGFEKDLFADNIGWVNDVYAVFIEPHDWYFPGQKTSWGFQHAFADEFELFPRGDNLIYVRV
jgi:FkbM family methyltransferase